MLSNDLFCCSCSCSFFFRTLGVNDSPDANVQTAIATVATNKAKWLTVSPDDKLAHMYELRCVTL